MKLLPDGREYSRSKDDKGWEWSHDSDEYHPCDAETCALLDEIMRLGRELSKTPEEQEAEAKEAES